MNTSSEPSRKRVLVTGATGFVGRNMIKRLAQDNRYDVHASFNRRPSFNCDGVTWVRADLTRSKDIEHILPGTDILIQAAATTSGAGDIVSRPYIHVTDNAVMNSLLFRAAFDHGVEHVVFFSCSVMYESSDVPARETHFNPAHGIHPKYFGSGWTKVYIEKQAEFFSSLGKTRFTILRHSNIYGPHDKFDLARSHICGATVTKVLSSEDGRITVWGRGTEARDLIYVDDLVECVSLILERQTEPYRLYNVGSGKAIKVIDLVQKVIENSGRLIAVEHDLTKPSIETSLSLDSSLIASELGWRPLVSLDDGLRWTIDWWLANTPVTAPGPPEVTV